MIAARASCAPGLQLPELPLNLVLLVLEQLPVSCHAKLVNKAAYTFLKDAKSVPASCPSLPLWVLQQMFQSVAMNSSSTDLGLKLINSRAAAGELPYLCLYLRYPLVIVVHHCTIALYVHRLHHWGSQRAQPLQDIIHTRKRDRPAAQRVCVCRRMEHQRTASMHP
jgi:hypothetical protein